jgi:hypothetical protein
MQRIYGTSMMRPLTLRPRTLRPRMLRPRLLRPRMLRPCKICPSFVLYVPVRYVLNCGVRFIADKIRYHGNCVRYVLEFIERSYF